MQTEDMILVSVDDHVVEPPDLFEGHLPKSLMDKAPTIQRKDDGTEVWLYEGNEIPNIGLNAVSGRPPEEYGIEPTAYSEMRSGCYVIADRIDDMNANGVLGSMCFPSFPQFCGQLFSRAQDKELGHVMLQAYNDWHVDEWCGTAPGRFIPLALPPIWDPNLMAQEVRRMAAKGCHAVTFSEDPSKLGWPSLHDEHWDPFYKACVDTGTIICLHIGSSSSIPMLTDAPIDVMITLTPLNLFQTAANLIWSPVLKRFPDIKFALSEGGIGWLPYFLERIDYVYERHRFWTHQDFGDMLPSQRARENFLFCFIDDKAGVRNRDLIGIDNITWECDYPHSDSSWPQSPEMLAKHFDDSVSDSDINKMSHLNAMRWFNYDPFAHRPKEQCTVGALRAEADGVTTSGIV
jgi:predicted TIM-barrel fold metal-dependent hydrolase